MSDEEERAGSPKYGRVAKFTHIQKRLPCRSRLTNAATIKTVEVMTTAATNTKANRGPRMSLELASRLFDWSSIALAIGACVVFISTAAIVWLGIVKEHHWDTG